MIYAYPAVLSPESDGRFSIWFPDLPGCATSGESKSDAIIKARDALGIWLSCAIDKAHTLPAPSDEVQVERGQMMTLVDIDFAAYRRFVDTKTVRKNVSLPAWQANMAEEAGLSLSQVLQEALIDRLGVSK